MVEQVYVGKCCDINDVFGVEVWPFPVTKLHVLKSGVAASGLCVCVCFVRAWGFKQCFGWLGMRGMGLYTQSLMAGAGWMDEWHQVVWVTLL